MSAGAAEDARELSREAAARRDPDLWARAATALLRHGFHDEAGLALLEARALGGHAAAEAVEHLLGEDALERLAVRVLAPIRGHLVAWSACGTRVYSVAEHTGAVREVTLDGVVRELAVPRRGLDAIATDRAGRWVVTLGRTHAGYSERTILAIDRKSGRTVETGVSGLGYFVYGISLWGDERLLFVHSSDRTSALPFDPESGIVTPTPVWKLDWVDGGYRFLGWDGSFVDVHGRAGAIDWTPPLAAGPRVRLLEGFTPAGDSGIFGGAVDPPSIPTGTAAKRFFAGPISRIGRAPNYVSTLAALSPGRLAALWTYTGERFTVLDVLSGSERALGVPHPDVNFFDGEWSPSGRKLALAGGSLVLVEPDEAPADLDAAWANRDSLLERLVEDHRPSTSEWLLTKLAEDPERVARCLARRRDPVDAKRLSVKHPSVEWLATVLEGAARGLRCNCDLDFRTAERHGTLVASDGKHHCRKCWRYWHVLGPSEPARPAEAPEERELPY